MGVLDNSDCLLGREVTPGACQGWKRNLLAIHKATGADTICRLEVYGLLAAAGAKVGGAVLNFLATLAAFGGAAAPTYSISD